MKEKAEFIAVMLLFMAGGAMNIKTALFFMCVALLLMLIGKIYDKLK